MEWGDQHALLHPCTLLHPHRLLGHYYSTQHNSGQYNSSQHYSSRRLSSQHLSIQYFSH